MAGCWSNPMLGICASIYLILGVGLIAGSAASFLTPFGEIISNVYAISTMGSGVAIFVIACIGLCAACEDQKKNNVVPLWLFTFLTLVMIIVMIAVTAVIFQYEEVLRIAANAGGETARNEVSNVVTQSVQLLDTASTAIISTLTTNTFSACGAVVNGTNMPMVYNFDCQREYFDTFANMINSTCMAASVTTMLNTTTGSVFYNCYEGNTFSGWDATVHLTDGLLATLNTPKGLFCACSSTVITDYILPNIAWAKYLPIGVAVFFLLVFCACIHQLCQRGCCGGKGTKEKDFNDVQMTYPDEANNKKKAGKKGQKLEDNYMVRP